MPSSFGYIKGKTLDKTPMEVQVQVNGQTETLQDPDEIAHAIQQYNKIHFFQADSGFFNQDRIQDIVDANTIARNLARSDTIHNIKQDQP
jgi:hypothetical protein